MRLSIAIFLTLSAVYPQVAYLSEKHITIAAASDLAFALKEISDKFEKETSIKTVLSFGSTGMLAMQIENGAPFDVFFSANEKYINDLKQKGLIIPETQRLYAQGRLVLAVNKKFMANVKKLENLLDPNIKKVAIANPNHAPYGIAAKEAMTKLGLWDKLKSKLVYGENIRQTLQFIQTGNADAGIIALSVANTPEIEYIMIDNSLHDPINQAVGLVKTTKVEKEAKRFIEYVNGPNGRPIMKKYGFLLPGEF